jgi:hypothetical protein
MLPPGLTADLAPSHRAALHQLHPSARTVARLLVGACSCDLFRLRHADPIQDERDLRARYGQSKLSRTETIKALERHRRGPLPRPVPSSGWPDALAGFVAEHARNAGPTLYLLEFTSQPDQPQRTVGSGIVTRSPQEVRLDPGRWLVEATPTVVR